MKRIVLIGILASLFAGCVSHLPAPVINRSPAKTSNNQSSDWRPNSYTVKKGDTLYSIGLEYGYDYREIAATNGIQKPYTIRVGQTLDFSNLNNQVVETAKPATYANEGDVIISPIDDGTITSQQVAETTAPTSPPNLSTPKAIKEPYSLEALNRKPAPEATPAEAEWPEVQPTTVANTPQDPTTLTPESTSANKPSVVEGISWSWPTQGKVSAKFNGASNKGLDIAGEKGQSIQASADGKVIYTGDDLRGYGKLVIVKHSKTLLSVYAHNSKINVKEGQLVKLGQKIAEMGDTDTDRTKLHFEIRQKGKSVDPQQFLPQT